MDRPDRRQVGPDGQVWMIDWYNIIVQHNPIPQGLYQAARAGRMRRDLRDKRHGRVYRLVYNDGKPSPVLNLAGATPEKLIEALKSDNMLWRTHAQRLLVERGNKDVIPALISLVNDPSVDAIGLNPAAIHAPVGDPRPGRHWMTDPAATAAASARCSTSRRRAEECADGLAAHGRIAGGDPQGKTDD